MYDCNFMECQVNVPICCLMANVMLLTSGNATSVPILMTSIHLCVRVVQMKSIFFDVELFNKNTYLRTAVWRLANFRAYFYRTQCSTLMKRDLYSVFNFGCS